MPDLTIYLDIPVEKGLDRKKRAVTLQRGEWNRLDQETIEFHRRVRQGYLQMAEAEPERWLVLDACRLIEQIQNEIREAVDDVLD
jgi:dTMP kinase